MNNEQIKICSLLSLKTCEMETAYFKSLKHCRFQMFFKWLGQKAACNESGGYENGGYESGGCESGSNESEALKSRRHN